MSVGELSVGEMPVEELSSGDCQSGNCPVGKLSAYQKNYHYRNILILQCAILRDIEKYIAPTFVDSTVEGNTRERESLPEENKSENKEHQISQNNSNQMHEAEKEANI